MGWFRLPPFFYAASETVADLTNCYMADYRLPTLYYGPTLGTYSTVPASPASKARLQAMDVYMDDLNCLEKGSPAQKGQVMEMVMRRVNDILPYLPAEIKDSISFKESQQGDGEWTLQKEILGWILNSDKGTFQMTSIRLK